MKQLPRRLCSALVTVLAGAVLAAPISGMPASSAAGDPSRPGSVPLTDAAHEPFHTGDAAAANLGDRVVFRAATPAMVQELRITAATSAGPRLPTLGDELWVSDGSAAGTHVVADIFDGGNGSAPRNVTAFGGRAAFSATVGSRDEGALRKPFVSDGTAAGTVRLGPLPLTTDAFPLPIVALGDRLLRCVCTVVDL